MTNNKKKSLGLYDSLKTNFKADFISGFLVFLIALPLCLGIADASNYPPIAGIYTAIIGGLVATFFSNSQLTIKGPAAGLIVIAVGAVHELGEGDKIAGYQYALAVGVVAGVVQIIFGLIKAGKFGDFFPASVIHGMLAAIGITIAAKQIHVALGVTPMSKDPIHLLMEIPNSFEHLNPHVSIIAAISLIILFGMPMVKNKYIRMIPAPVIVLLMAIPTGIYEDIIHEHHYIMGSHYISVDPSHYFVSLPKSFLDGVHFPDFSKIFSTVSIKYIIMFALVGSIESLLSAKAIDSLDPQKRTTNMDKDLRAVGMANTFSSFIGGLPMISEIVRSSANINNGGKSKWANFFHGLFLLIFVILAAPLIEMIPYSALAAMLIYTGYKLAAPTEFIKTYKIGSEQLALFIITLVVTLATDLLLGVAAGIVLKIVFHLMNGANFKSLFKINLNVSKKEDKHYQLEFKGPAIFSNFLGFKKVLNTIPLDSNVILDFSKAPLVDHTFMENIHHLENNFQTQGGHLNATGFENHHYSSNHPLSARTFFRNPLNKTGVVQLNKRQKELQVLAGELGLEFEPVFSSPSLLKMNFSPFPIGRYMKYARNILFGTSEKYNYFIADLHIESYSAISKRNYDMTVLNLSNLEIKLPDFIIEEEGFFDFLSEMKGAKDIDFDSHPKFSDKYYLKGEDEKAIRKFFTPDLLTFFEKSDKYYIECKNSNLLIHKDPIKLSAKDIKDMITWLDQLINVIVKK